MPDELQEKVVVLGRPRLAGVGLVPHLAPHSARLEHLLAGSGDLHTCGAIVVENRLFLRRRLRGVVLMEQKIAAHLSELGVGDLALPDREQLGTGLAAVSVRGLQKRSFGRLGASRRDVARSFGVGLGVRPPCFLLKDLDGLGEV